MKSLKAERITIKLGDIWESPELHVLVTREDNVIVARCLEFTVSSHGVDIKEAIDSLAESIKEYILSAMENDAVHTIFDPAHSKYWRMFNEREAKQTVGKLKRSLKKSSGLILPENMIQSPAEIRHA